MAFSVSNYNSFSQANLLLNSLQDNSPSGALWGSYEKVPLRFQKSYILEREGLWPMLSRFLEWSLYSWKGPCCHKSFGDFNTENYHSNLDLTFHLKPFLFLRNFSLEDIRGWEVALFQNLPRYGILIIFLNFFLKNQTFK